MKQHRAYMVAATAGYWQGEDEKARPGDALRYGIRQAADELAMTAEDVDDFLAGEDCSSGRYDAIETAPKRWLAKLLEALKAMKARRAMAAGR